MYNAGGAIQYQLSWFDGSERKVEWLYDFELEKKEKKESVIITTTPEKNKYRRIDMNLNIGDVFIAADGNKYGHLVTDIETYASCNDVVTIPFNERGLCHEEAGNRIDIFKLTKVRYFKPDVLPKWIPSEVILGDMK